MSCFKRRHLFSSPRTLLGLYFSRECSSERRHGYPRELTLHVLHGWSDDYSMIRNSIYQNTVIRLISISALHILGICTIALV
jgi:hypothetical protein